MLVEIVESTAQALIEDGASANGKRAVSTDGETINEERVGLDGVVELELGVGNDFSGTTLLIFENTALQSDNWCGTTDGFDLALVELPRSVGDVERLDNESARGVTRTSWWVLGCNSGSKGGESNDVLHFCRR